MLADNRVERKLRSNAASPSLLAGLVRDEDGVPMTPTHADKRGRRYRDYVGRDLVVVPPAEGCDEPSDRRRRSASRRIPAIDLEAVVEDRLATFLRDAATVDGIVSSRVASIEERRRRIERAGDLGATWPSLPRPEKIAVLRRLVAGITLGCSSLEIVVAPDGLSDVAGSNLEDLMKLSSEPRGEELSAKTLAMTADLPADWDEQRRALGFR